MEALIDDTAELGSENDEEFDEETGEVARKTNGANGGMEDSSEEEDDDDEEAEREVREGFIVDEDEDEEDAEAKAERRRQRKRRRKEEEEEALDEEDLDLIGETTEIRKPKQSKYKRLRVGHRDERDDEPRGVEEIFSDDEDDAGEVRPAGRGPRAMADEFADFIEEDEFEDEERQAMIEEQEVARPGAAKKGFMAGLADSQLDEAAYEDLKAAFGDGNEYDWALAKEEEEEEEEERPDRPLELKDVFEPSQLVDKMLTEEDNIIRNTDIPERFQVARKAFKQKELDEEEFTARLKEEAVWISTQLLPRKRDMATWLRQPFQKAVQKALEFMNKEEYEVPFIFQNRKDHLIHDASNDPEAQDDPDGPGPNARPERLLASNDLWEIFELDLKFRGLVEKRDALQETYDRLKEIANITDDVVEEMLPQAMSTEEIQDIQDYLHFQYSAELKDVNHVEAETNGVQKRARVNRALFEKIRGSRVYEFVNSFGLKADSFAQNLAGVGRRKYTDDPQERPEDMADNLLEPPEYQTGTQVTRAGKAMYIEELVMSPRMRKYIRQRFYQAGMIDCIRTEKGLRKITEDHPYYEFKYLRGQDLHAMARRPELFLRMIRAEEEGLVEVRFRLDGYERLKSDLHQAIESDNFSDVADAWNRLRKEVADQALLRLAKTIARGVKETLKSECENTLLRTCRERYSEKLDQAPYKPRGMAAGTTPRVLALSNGNGVPGRDAICWAWVEEDGRVLESGKFVDLRLGDPEKFKPDGRDVAAFVELVQRRKPDVIAVSGFATETRRLLGDIENIVERHDLNCPPFEDEDGNEKVEKLDVLMVNDEVARLYQTSERAAAEHPGTAPLVKYCIALAKYLQNPLSEYAALGKDIISINFDPNQNLLPQDKLMKYLESSIVDIVNLVGVEINEAVADPYVANLLPYVCGLGPRKAAEMLKVINRNGGEVRTRDELVGDPDKGIVAAVGPKVWTNCASFVYISYDRQESDLDYLDSTRVHPEDYELGRKMAADAMDLDEEDIKAEVLEHGPAAVVSKLINEEAQEKVNDLVLEEYAKRLEVDFNSKKRATLETIRAELQQPFEELRRNFEILSKDEEYTMLTGETRDSLQENMIVPITIKRIFPDHIECKLDCGIDGGISEDQYGEGVGSNGVDPRHKYAVNSTMQAKILFLNRKNLTAQLTLREDNLRRPFKREIDHLPGEWDDAQEAQDKRDAQKQKEDVTGRVQRVIKHPLFKPFNAHQAEEFLGGANAGDVVVRPSGKGLDHLAITWKVSDNVYQHIDVLELDKENEFSVGKTLKIGGKYTYSDLDELIANHVRAMFRKVEEMMGDEKYQNGSKSQTGKLSTPFPTHESQP